jgi:hypothetical protein
MRIGTDVQMTVTYEVGGSTSSGRLDIDFYVSPLPPPDKDIAEDQADSIGKRT